ncbi:MAG: TonB-dependent receptor plug domain-containing protein [Elusimicrobiales bacterium]|nr:TonB-dependent receptor plug domain-containing protein [Elusimicrobiales bacterium]
MLRLLILSLLLLPGTLLAGWPARTDEDEFFSLERATLEQALNIKTSVASRSAMGLRETPGLVAVITREEIQALGARDLTDVLKLVPEFDFGMDVQGNLGLGVRGNWGNEGKVLLMWDGQSYNEPLYSTVQFDRFPVDQIEEIEIIKGPGSALYGGFAELAVINIRTRTARALDGSLAYAAYGQGERARARNYAGYAFGKVFNGTEISGKAHWGEAQRSDRRYTDFSGTSYSMNRASDLRPRSLNLQAAGKDTSLRLILDSYTLRERDHFGEVLSTGSAKVQFPSVFAEFKHTLYLPWLVKLEPRLSYARTMAWLEKDEYFAYDKKTQRVTAAFTAFRSFGTGAEVLAGGEYFHDGVKVDELTAAPSRYASGKEEANFDNYAFFGQGSFNPAAANFVVGARYDKHSQYGASLVPRFAVTRLFNDFNFKAIYSQAFRAPAIENIRLASDNGIEIKPEKATSAELEAGYKASETLYFSANLFQTTIKRPIIFTYVNNAETYRNYDRTGTRGMGVAVKFKSGTYRADLAYQTYAARGNRVDVYSVPAHGSCLLGFPRHKFVAGASLPLGKGFSANPSAIYLSRRYGYAGDGALRSFGERVIADLNLQAKDRLLPRLTLNLGIKDVFKSNYAYIQPYTGGHAPLPAASREIFLKAAYEF